MARRWHAPPVSPEVADRRHGRQGRPDGRSLHHVLHDDAPLDAEQPSHRLGRRPGFGYGPACGCQRLVDFLAVPAALSVSSRPRPPIAVVAPSTLWASLRWASRSWAAKSNTESPTSAGVGSWSVRGKAAWAVPGTSCWMVSAQVRMPSMTASWLLRMPSSTCAWSSWVGSFSVGMGCVLLYRVTPLVLTTALTSVGCRLRGQTWSVNLSRRPQRRWQGRRPAAALKGDSNSTAVVSYARGEEAVRRMTCDFVKRSYPLVSVVVRGSPGRCGPTTDQCHSETAVSWS